MTPIEYLRRQKEKNPLQYLSHKLIYLLLGLLLVIFIFMIFSMLSNRMSNRDTYYFGVRPTLIITGSMEPTIMTNSIVIVEEVSFEEVNEGDIIRYNSESGISVVHRVIYKGDNYFITQGDNNEYPDNELVYYPKLNGRVTDIHNEVAPIVTSIFGVFNPTDMGSGMLRMLLGFVKLAVGATMLVLLIAFIYDLIATNHFWLKKQEKMQRSLEWTVSNRVTADQFNRDVEEYRDTMKRLKWRLLRKLWLSIYFKHYYSGLTEEQKKVDATNLRAKRFRKYIASYKIRENTE